MDKKETVRLVVISSLVTFFVVIILFGGGYLLYTKYISGFISRYQVDRQSKAILTEVGKVVFLPEEEKPEVATILNAEQLKINDSFFASAKNGDATLFYDKSGMIILFSMESHKLLNMGIIATSSASASETAPASSFKFNK